MMQIGMSYTAAVKMKHFEKLKIVARKILNVLCCSDMFT